MTQPNTWILDRTILLVRHGSHAYGTSLPTSDQDYRGIAVAPAPYYHGYLNRFEQCELKDPDTTIFDVRKFFTLASQCNPNVLEMLYVDREDIISPQYRRWAHQQSIAQDRLLSARDLFLSKQAKHTYSGYAMAQMKRIKTHYRWLKTPPKSPPTRASMGLPERTVIPADQLKAAQAMISKRLEDWETDYVSDLEPGSRIQVQNAMAEIVAELKITADDKYLAAARSLGFSDNFLVLLDAEKRYKSAKTEWDQYQTWVRQRNPARAELEAKWGYDTKHAMHLVRLMRMCREILTEHTLHVRRPDAEELLAIRHGAWTYEALVEWAEREDAELAEVARISTLRASPDRVKLDALCQRIVESML